ncbi:rho guanyl-nucleotide exchange factor 1 [Actinidia rufa]|uniref:Rho guanyl-nucleotide exchange factor 1 n=1 Tax=Actinidia rufa TaxID=165716 RepID=A0A7J0GUP6_9ERIC|nr:rho guanyl-nucleotide exchange factor 1 [Actinidia rufa]
MASRPRFDLYMNLPALKKLDAMLVSILDGFQDTEFCYVDRDIVVADANNGKVFPSAATRGRPLIRPAEKWLPCPKVPPKGLSEDARKKLQQCRDCTNQILKAAMAINSSVLARMDIPNAYLWTLPKLSIFVIAVGSGNNSPDLPQDYVNSNNSVKQEPASVGKKESGKSTKKTDKGMTAKEEAREILLREEASTRQKIMVTQRISV